MAGHRAGAARQTHELLHFPSGLVLFVRLLLLLTALPFVYLLELAFSGNSLLQARLWSEPSDRFGDFWHYRSLLESLHRPEFFSARDRFAYPAPCALLYQWLYGLGTHPHVSFNLILWGVEAASAWFLLRALVRHGLNAAQAFGLIALLALTSYPWHFLYDRGNIELFVYVLVSLGLWAWSTGHDQAAALLWACAGSLKIYPLVLLAIFCRRGGWRSAALGLAAAAGLLLFSFWYVGPTMKIAANGTMWGIRGFVGTYGAHTRFNELVLDHSLLGGLKEIVSLPFLHPAYEQITLSHVYEGVVILLGPVAFLRWRRSAPPLNQMCLLLLTLMALPPVSYDYTLIYAYLVLGVVLCAYLDAVRQGEPFPGCRTYFVSFAILCTAEGWISVYGFQPNGLFKSAALVSVGVLLVRFPLRLPSLRCSSSPNAPNRRRAPLQRVQVPYTSGWRAHSSRLGRAHGSFAAQLQSTRPPAPSRG